MRYFKMVKDGYILTIGTGAGGVEISGAEYEELRAVFLNRPNDTSNIYELRADTLTWEQTGSYEEIEEELTDAEALAILLGGAV